MGEWIQSFVNGGTLTRAKTKNEFYRCTEFRYLNRKL